MKVPDKIYTCYNIEEGEKRQLWSTVLLSDVEQVGEYIRKDALLEWARKKNKRIDTDDGDYSLGYISAMIDLIDKLNSM